MYDGLMQNTKCDAQQNSFKTSQKTKKLTANLQSNEIYGALKYFIIRVFRRLHATQ